MVYVPGCATRVVHVPGCATRVGYTSVMLPGWVYLSHATRVGMVGILPVPRWVWWVSCLYPGGYSPPCYGARVGIVLPAMVPGWVGVGIHPPVHSLPVHPWVYLRPYLAPCCTSVVRPVTLRRSEESPGLNLRRNPWVESLSASQDLKSVRG